ncbi:MAG TPA: CrcB family protein [Ktedonobacterales bacterium]
MRAKSADAAMIIVGGALGTAARVAASWAVGRWLGHALPYDILLVNVSGSFVLGALAGLVPTEVRHRHPHWLIGGIGFLGAYTTFSSLAYGSVQLLAAGQTAAGVLYPLGSVALGVAAVGLGDLAGVWLANRRRAADQASTFASGREAQPDAHPAETIEAVEAWAERLLDGGEPVSGEPVSRDPR